MQKPCKRSANSFLGVRSESSRRRRSSNCSRVPVPLHLQLFGPCLCNGFRLATLQLRQEQPKNSTDKSVTAGTYFGPRILHKRPPVSDCDGGQSWRRPGLGASAPRIRKKIPHRAESVRDYQGNKKQRNSSTNHRQYPHCRCAAFDGN